MAKVPEAQRKTTDLERPAFVAAAFLFCAAQRGIFLKRGVVQQRVEVPQAELRNAIHSVAQTLGFPESPFDRAQWRPSAGKRQTPAAAAIKIAAPSAKSTAGARTEATPAATAPTEVAGKESEASVSPSAPSAADKEEHAGVGGKSEKRAREEDKSAKESEDDRELWKKSVLKAMEDEQKAALEAQPKRKRMRQSTFLF